MDHKERWALKNWCFWTVVLEKTLESPLDCKEIKPVNTKINQSWIFIGRTDAEAPSLWPSDAKSYSLEKSLMLGKIEGSRRRRRQRMRWLDGITNLMDIGAGDGQGSLVCCSLWGHKELDMTTTKRLTWTELTSYGSFTQEFTLCPAALGASTVLMSHPFDSPPSFPEVTSLIFLSNRYRELNGSV